MMKLFRDRKDSGRSLADALERYKGTNAIVIALPRGGVVVGNEVSQALGLRLDVIVTRKIGAPSNPEYAIGAIAETGNAQLNEEEIRLYGIPSRYIDDEIQRQRLEIERRVGLYRNGHKISSIRGEVVILVDDGIATGFTMFAAIRALKAHRPQKIVLAVPLAPMDVIDRMRAEVDEVVCLASPEPFMAVGIWYENFEQTTDEEVRNYMELARQRVGGSRHR
jgi:putative phosphoribosyl transferase